jgi:CheY-like chemotaxis protein
MAFECLLFSRDPKVVCTLNHVLDNLSFSTKVCLTPSKAITELRGGSPDLVVIDWEEDNANELLDDIRRLDTVHKKTIVAVTSAQVNPEGAHTILRKPVTAESSSVCLKNIYGRMLRDYRRHARYALMISVIATAGENRLVPLTVTNIGDGGIGVSTRESLSVGELLSLRLPLPGARRAIYVEARVLWTRDYGVCGCAFMRIPPVDLDILHDWLKAKCQIKKPLLPV